MLTKTQLDVLRQHPGPGDTSALKASAHRIVVDRARLAWTREHEAV